MFSEFSPFLDLQTTSSLFYCILMHILIAVTMLAFCAKKSKKEEVKSEPQSARDPLASQETPREPGGGNERSRHHFTPPHIATAAPGPSALKHRHQPCPIHCQFSETSQTNDDSFVDSANTSDIEFDSTQSLSGGDHNSYLAEQCTCICAPKQVRFQCPKTSSRSMSSRRFI
ncbi:hypothetical protein B9Z55_000524 [Caenorhabditis nigoni]|uniref:Uncharacterized protein n=2 Tax=Caenorhabditis nigoni TaxID=1611254 RepID=A0A2G5VTG9_9PELO|nr:hypothetical protein B9Z55_000524 [Caenorhabditis nigoni]